MLRLNFALYTGQTLLRDWWRQVKSHFTEVQDAHNSLCDTVVADKAELAGLITDEENARKAAVAAEETARIAAVTAEASARTNAYNTIRESVAAEQAERESADNAIRTELSTESAARINADSELAERVTGEQSARESEDRRLRREIETLEAKSHTHENKTVLDGITSDDVAAWNDRADYDAQNKILIENLEDAYRAMQVSISELYGAVGVTLYDGGADGAEYDGAPLNGGEFDEEDTLTIDCGEFDENIFTPVGSVVDGGTY